MSASAAADLVLVDTSAWIGFLARQGHHQLKILLGQLLDEDRVATGGPILLELLQGSRSIVERDRLQERLQGLHWLESEDRHWHASAVTAFEMRRLGVTVGAVDVFIATLAQDHGCILLHQDSDFRSISRHTGLRVVD